MLQRVDHVSLSAAYGSLVVLLNELCYQSGPAGLMAGPNTGAIVAVKVLMERHQIVPVWIGLEFSVPPNTGRLPCRRAKRSSISRRDIPPRLPRESSSGPTLSDTRL